MPRRSPRQLPQLVAVVIALAVFTAACGGDSDSTSSTDTSAPSDTAHATAGDDSAAASTPDSAEVSDDSSADSSSATSAPDGSAIDADTTVATTAAPPETVVFTTEPAFAANSDVTTVGIDRVTFGMTVEQAENALAVRLEGDGPRSCHYVRPSHGPEGVELMVTDGTIERVDITTDLITTRSGAGVGLTKGAIFDMFEGRIETEAHPTNPAWEQMVFTPADEGDDQFRVIFEIGGDGVVKQYRSGRVPMVEFPNGCP